MAQKGVHNLTYGMYLLTTRENGQDFGYPLQPMVQCDALGDAYPPLLAYC